MQISINITGTTPLLMRSADGVNAEHPLNQQKSVLTRKTASKRTGEENREIRRLEWLLGLYTDDDQIVYPTANVIRCLNEAGKVSKDGAKIRRGLSFDGTAVPLDHAGVDRPIDDLFNDANFVDDRSVGIGQKRVMRTRPRFYPWGVSLTGEIFDDVINIEDVQRIAKLAGRAIGLGDNRVNGFGRFVISVKEA